MAMKTEKRVVQNFDLWKFPEVLEVTEMYAGTYVTSTKPTGMVVEKDTIVWHTLKNNPKYYITDHNYTDVNSIELTVIIGV